MILEFLAVLGTQYACHISTTDSIDHICSVIKLVYPFIAKKSRLSLSDIEGISEKKYLFQGKVERNLFLKMFLPKVTKC